MPINTKLTSKEIMISKKIAKDLKKEKYILFRYRLYRSKT